VNDSNVNERAYHPPPGLPSEPPDHCASEPGPVCGACVTWLIQRRRLVLWLALAVSVLGVLCSARLYSDLRSGIEELLPDTAASVIAARTLAPKLHSVSQLSIILEGQDGDALGRLAEEVVSHLRALPDTLVQSIEYRTDQQEAFLRRFGALYLSPEDIDAIQRRLDARIAWEKRRANPLTHLIVDEDATEQLGPAPPLDFKDIEAKYSAVNGALAQFRNGYFQTPDGHLLAIIVRPPESATGLSANRKLLDAAKEIVNGAHPRSYDPTVRVGYGSEVAGLVEEQEALIADLASSTVIVVGLVLLALWVYFRRWTAILAILGALGAGCALSFGASLFLVGHLNANTAFLGSIVLGNGINVSIIVVARYLEERQAGRGIEAAMTTAWSRTLGATFVASFGAGLAYLSLSITDFRGFSQFGVIGGVGMAFCWVTAYLLLPSLLAALDSRSRRGMTRGRRPFVGRLVSHLTAAHLKATRVLTLALLVAAALAVVSYRGQPIEYDIGKLRAAKSAKNGDQYWSGKLDQIFRSYLTPVVIHGETTADLLKVTAELERERSALGSEDPFREVRTLESAIPSEQADKLPHLARLRETLNDSRLEKMDPEMRRKALELRPPADLRRVTLDDLPEAMRLQLTERDGTAGRLALAFPKKVGTLNAKDIDEITRVVRGAIARSHAQAQAIGQPLLFDDLASAIARDGPRATVLALALVCALVVAVVRRFAPSAQVIASLLLGIAWLVGAAAAARVRFNFLNFVVLPITFGIGVDYAVNIVQRWRLEGAQSLDRVLRETGGAVALCSLTTVIGYGSLLVADNRALRGFGLLASFGELACIAAALVAMPAWLLRPKGLARSKAPPL